ncbi:MAG: helix-turn-helix transcriptional regulator [Clostridia bacterium]|nr:helix-turn-helix transcriptional regulator [Clostridia bacterium]
MNRIPVIDMTATGINITRMRKMAGMTVKDLQDIFGFSTPQAIYKWQRGVALPTVDNLAVLAAVFDVRIDDILIFQGETRCQTLISA